MTDAMLCDNGTGGSGAFKSPLPGSELQTRSATNRQSGQCSSEA